MSVSDLVRKFRRAVGDADAPAPSKKTAFDWEPAAAAPMTTSAPLEDPAPREPEPTSRGASASWKRPSEASSVVGSGIPADVADFAIVYKGAGVQAPSHGYGVDRVADMLAHKSLAGLDKSVKASAVLAALDAAHVSIQEVIHDGLLRYKALVAFEAAKELELQQVRPGSERTIEELRREVEGFRKSKQAEIDALTREGAAAVAALTRLQTRQRTEEERFHRTVSLFVEPMPARVIPMAPKPPDVQAAAEAKADLKLVPSAPPAPGAPVKDGGKP